MKLLLRRDQKKGLLGGKVTFTLDVRAELAPDEVEHVKKYKLGDTMLYQKIEEVVSYVNSKVTVVCFCTLYEAKNKILKAYR